MALNEEQRGGAQVRRWGLNLPYLLPVVAAIALVIIVRTSMSSVLGTAQSLAQEDAALLNWWHVDQRERLNDQAGMLAERIRTGSDFAETVARIGLADHRGYIAWIDGSKVVRSAVNEAAVIGDPAATKLFGFTPAVGRPSGDFWIENGQLMWMGMAPVDPETGGGVVVIQQPITDETVTNLAELVGRDVIFYSFEEQKPLLSSNTNLISDPPRLGSRWMNQVATGQLPDSIRTSNSQGGLIVGMTAFPDFAALTYSGYVGLVESVAVVGSLLPMTNFWLAVLISVLLTAIGAWFLRRVLLGFLQDFRTMEYRARRAVKLRMVGITLVVFLPTVLAAGYIVTETSNRSAFLDQRTAQIAKDILIGSADSLTSRYNLFATDDTAVSLPAESAEELAAAVQKANGVEFVLIDTGDAVAQASLEELSQEMIGAITAIPPGQVDIVQSGNLAFLAAAQPGPDGSTAYGGVRLNKRLSSILEVSGADLTVLNRTEPVFTTLADREIESLYFDAQVEEELARTGQASYLQKVGWNPGRLTLYGLNIAGSDQWRLIISQASVTWSNAVRAYQGIGLAAVATALVVVIAVLMTILNLDKPLLLRRLYTGYLFILPAVVWLVWWQLGPALFAGYLSFHKWSVLSPAKPFVGLHNYRQIMNDDVFWNAMVNTFIYVSQIPLGMALALALALALNRPLKGIKALRTIYYMPAVTSIVVVSLMWKLLYNKDLGIFNYLLSFIGLGPYGFLQSTSMALPSIMGMAIWLGLGARMILFLAGLQSISDDYYEAADVDGASGWNKFLHITIPLLAPTTFFVFITSIIGSFQVFGPIYVLTQGGPAGASDVAVHRIYFEAWQNLRFGYASAETVILFAFLFIVTAVQFRYFGRNVSYG